MSIQKLREERTEKVREYRNLLDKNPGKLSAGVSAKLDELHADIVAVEDRINREERILRDEADNIINGRIPGAPHGMENADAIKALGEYYRNGDFSGFGFRNALTESSDGGVLAPRVLSDEITNMMQKFSPIRQIAKVINITTTPSRFSMPVNSGITATGWVGEADARSATAPATLQEVVFSDSELYCNIPVSAWLEEDSMVGPWLVEEIGRQFARAEGAAFINGTGTKQPKGILAYTTATTVDESRTFGQLQYVPSLNASLIGDGTQLITLLYSLKAAYRANATWVLNAGTLAVIRKLKDSNNRFLWEPGLAGEPQSLLGYPICECDDMPDVAANALAVAVGDFKSGYCIVDRTMVLLRDPYTNKPNVNFYCRKRVSAAIIDSNAIKVLKIAAS